jgi:streptogramin lyase
VNGNLVVDTSQPVNGTPGIQIADAAEFLAEGDECIAMTVVVGALGESGGGLRALALDAGRDGPGNPWTGTYSEQAFYQIDGTTGALLQRVATPGVKGYSAAIDSLGRLWATDDCCGSSPNLGRIDTLQNPAPFAVVASLPPFRDAGNNTIDDGSFAVAVDLANRVWIAGSPFGGMMRYDPGLAEFTQATITGYLVGGDARGAAVDSRGSVWTSFVPDVVAGKVARIDAATATATEVFAMSDSSGGSALLSTGVGVDRAGDVWTSNRQTSNVSRMHMDATSGEPAPHPTTGDVVDVFPVGPNPNVHSDFTGMAYRRVTRPDGDYRVRLPTCVGEHVAHWLDVEWSATMPAGTRVELYVRTGSDAATVGQAPPQGPWTNSPADLQLTPGPVGDSIHMQLTLRLISESPLDSATLHSYRVTRICPAP